jgi:hypothetical protein
LNIIILLWSLFAVVLWSDREKLKECYSTMLYMICMNLLYLYFSNQQYPLWELEPELFLNQSAVHILHLFFIYPVTVFIFLSNYPQKILSQVIHITKWVFIYSVTEWIGYSFGRISYYNGWNFGWSIFFMIMMFPMLRIHYSKKAWAIPLSVIWILFYLFIFDYYNWNPWRDIQ